MTQEKFFGLLGWVGMVTSVLMYVFYFPQIQQNLAGNKGSFIQPFMAGINCTFWLGYGLFKKDRDWPIVIANSPGLIFGFFGSVYIPINQGLIVYNDIRPFELLLGWSFLCLK